MLKNTNWQLNISNLQVLCLNSKCEHLIIEGTLNIVLFYLHKILKVKFVKFVLAFVNYDMPDVIIIRKYFINNI